MRHAVPYLCERAFVAFSGVQATAGFTVIDFDAAQVKAQMLRRAKQAIAVADSSKVGQVAFACVAPLTAAHLFLTDAGLLAEDRAALEEAGLRLIVAG